MSIRYALGAAALVSLIVGIDANPYGSAAKLRPGPTPTPSPVPTMTPGPTPTPTIAPSLSPTPTPSEEPVVSARPSQVPPGDSTGNALTVVWVLEHERCWAEFGSGWAQVDWTANTCRYRTYDSWKWVVFEYTGAVTGYVYKRFYDRPWHCGTPAGDPLDDMAITWSFAEEGFDTCNYQMRRYPNYGPPYPDSTQTRFNGPAGPEYTPDSYVEWIWFYVPVTDASQVVAFSFEGIDWTFVHHGGLCFCTPLNPDPSEGY
jgi:hypothetical protein